MDINLVMGRLLILDDDRQVSKTIKELAKAAGYEAQAFTEPQSFFAAIPEFNPTHIVLDLAMPELDGVEVMKELSRIHCKATIIIVSGLGQRVLNAAQLAAKESGLRVAGVLNKPFRITALRSLLSRYSGITNPALAVSPDEELSEAELQQAISENQVRVWYQPQIDCSTRELSGFEALVRIETDGKIITPNRFVPLAERSGYIQQLSDLVFEQAIKWFASEFKDTGIRLSLNTSPGLLANKSLPASLSQLCTTHGIEPAQIILEITETSAATNPSMALELLTQLRVKGFHLSIDDFGVGYSSLEQLARQPFSGLKIDKGFVIPLAQSEDSRKINTSLIALASALQLTSTAEGVEDEFSLNFLEQAGCGHAQGFYIAKPMPESEVLKWARDYHSNQRGRTGQNR